MRNTTYTWQQAVQEAIAESDPNELERKVQLAEVAIFERIDTFSAADRGDVLCHRQGWLNGRGRAVEMPSSGTALCYKSQMAKIIEPWSLFRFIGREFTPLSKSAPSFAAVLRG